MTCIAFSVITIFQFPVSCSDQRSLPCQPDLTSLTIRVFKLATHHYNQ